MLTRNRKHHGLGELQEEETVIQDEWSGMDRKNGH